MGTAAPYNESLLQWLWQNRYLQNQDLATQQGDNVIVHHPGYLNASDGPDFTNACITIGELTWHGDIEIHWRSSDWFSHKHHIDENFNRIILHVVYDNLVPKQIHCQDGTTPPTLQMKPFLSESLQYFFQHFQQPNTLPCTGNIATVPRAVLFEQFERAHHEYFEQKVNDLLTFYNATLPLSKAWLEMLAIGLFDGLGISYNRTPMRKLAAILLHENDFTNKPALVEKALRLGGIEPKNTEAPFQWKRKGSRPANHPESRVRQACSLLYFIKDRPFGWWLRTNIDKSFQKMIQQVDTKPRIGPHQSGVLFGTVWLAAFYILGDLAGTERLRNEASDLWLKHRTALPKSITKPFYQANIPATVFEKKLGTVHQYRAYCNPHKCQQCSVFNNIISS